MKILVISSNLIGDTILSTGVIKYFNEKYPNSKFTFIIGPSAEPIFKNFKNVEKVITISKKQYNLHWFQILINCIGIKWDIVIDFRSSLISYLLFHKKKYIFKKNSNTNQISQLSTFFGFDCSDLFIETSTKEEDNVKKNISKNYKYFVIFPGGNWKPKIWDAKNYNSLLKIILSKNKNIKFILVGSKYEEKIYYTKIIKDIEKKNIINLFGETLSQTSAYMKQSTLLIGNDSGLTHLAAASKLNSFVLFGPTNDKVYGPYFKNSHVIRTKESYNDFKNMYIDSAKSYMESISPEKIYEKLKLNGYCN